MRFDPLQVDFSVGEVSPQLDRRVDIDKFKAGVKTMENFFCMPHGPAVKRGGTRFIAKAKYSDKETRLIEFAVSSTETFMLEVGDLYIRIYTDQGQLVKAELITNGDMEIDLNWVDYNTPTTNERSSEQAHGGTYSRKFVAAAEDDGIRGDDYTTVTGKSYTGGLWVYSSEGTVEVAIRKGDNSGWVQQTEHEIIASTWTWIPIEYTETAGGVAAYVVIASSSVDTTGTWYVDDVSVKEIFEITTTYTELEVFDIGYTQSADVLYLAHKDHAPAKLIRSATYTWTLSNITFTAPPTDWGAADYPQVVAIHEQRLYWANIPSYPQSIYASKSADYEDMTTGTGDDDAFEYTIGSNKLVSIKWMLSTDILVVGTSGVEFKLTSNNLGDAITPTNVNVKPQTNYGSSKLQAIKINDTTIFVQKGHKKIRGFSFKFEKSAFTADDLVLLNEHITGGKGVTIVDSTYSNEPHSQYWVVRSDGVIAGMTYEPAIGVSGWYRYVIAGTDVIVKSIKAIDSTVDQAIDDIYMIVDRTVNSTTVKYIELLMPSLQNEEDQEDAFYVDSGLSYSGSGETIFQNLNHLEGETVVILADGATVGDEVVSAGRITIDREGDEVHVGLGYAATLRTLKQEGGNQIGTSQGKIKRVSKVIIGLYRSLGLKIGIDGVYDVIPFGPGIMDEAPSLFSGDKEVPMPTGYNTHGEIELYQDQPLPLTIAAIMPRVRTE